MRDHVNGRGVKIDDTATYTGNFNWIDCQSSVVIDSMTCAIEGDMSGFTYAPGWHRVDATTITLASGTLVAHSE
jgi:hypothetical protein